jgi:Domain of Unknown Function with PDB structure (DUF3857)/Transglutaminase-like superfamily
MMTVKSFFSPPKPPRGINPLALGVILILVCAATLPGADSVPDWVRAAAREPLPAAMPKDAKAVVLYNEQVITVHDSGEVELLFRSVSKILRHEGSESYHRVTVQFADDEKILSLKGWTLPADGKEFAVKEKDSIETSPYIGDLYDDLHLKILEIPAAVPGNVVAYEYVQKRRPYIFDDSWEFQQTVPVHRARFTLNLPPGWEFKTQWANHTEVQEQKSGDSYTWELLDVPAIEIEPHMPPWSVIAGRMGLKYFPAGTSAVRTNTSASWKDIALWYGSLTTNSRQSTPEIKQKVAEITANATSTYSKIEAITDFMQRQIRYVAIEIGIGGFQPHPASTVFQYKYGDCKDKATLLSAMLHEIGVDSYYVVAQVFRGVVRPDFPSQSSFNHMILAIRLPDDVKEGNLYAVLNHPKLGRLLIFDPTNEFTPLGYIPDYEQSNYGLLVTPDGGELIALPLLPPSTNRLMRTGKVSLSPQGDLTADINEIRWGAPADDFREQLNEVTPANRAKVIEAYLGGSLNNFHLTSATIGNLDARDETLTLHYKFAVDRYAQSAGNLLLLRPGIIADRVSNVDLSPTRKYPVEFAEATVQSDDFEISVPQGYVADDLPSPVDVKSDYGNYRSKMEISGDTLHYQRLYELKKVYVPTVEFPAARDFFGEVTSDERASAVLKKSP